MSDRPTPEQLALCLTDCTREPIDASTCYCGECNEKRSIKAEIEFLTAANKSYGESYCKQADYIIELSKQNANLKALLLDDDIVMEKMCGKCWEPEIDCMCDGEDDDED